jgi:Rieske 2Fe-2S family protein
MNGPPGAFRGASVGGGASTLPGRYYTDEVIFREESERIFARHWVCLGRAVPLPAPGDYLVAQVAGESLLVVRGGDGPVRALYNVCRHRGARLCTDEQGRFPGAIRCPYHAWTYGLDGRLRSAPTMDGVASFDQGDYPLVRAELAEWEGFWFVNLAAAPEPFPAALAPLIRKFAAWHLTELREARRIEYEVRANWKQIVENYSECYHCPSIHPQLCRLSPAASGRNDLDEGPVLGGYSTLNRPGGSLTVSGQTARPPLGEVAGEDLSRVYYYAIFPNLLLSLHPDYVLAHTLRPVGAGHTHVTCAWLFDPAVMAAPGFDPGDAVEFWDLTNRQDWSMCERAQLGAGSRAYTPGPYSHAEGLLAAFDREYLRRMAGPLPGFEAGLGLGRADGQ